MSSQHASTVRFNKRKRDEDEVNTSGDESEKSVELVVPDVDELLQSIQSEKSIWVRLMRLTYRHAKFKSCFSFPKSDTPGWVKTQPASSSKRTYPEIVSLDCEMCVTIDPATNEKNSKALVRLSLVDGLDPTRVLVDCIVAQPEIPSHVVFNYKTNIHGITPEQIHSSQITFKQAQKKMLKYISSNTIVVGQSVYGDLTALKVIHHRVIDTAFIFKRRGDLTGKKLPGLKDLASQLLNLEMPDSHDSVFDAQMAMKAVHYAKNPGAIMEVKQVYDCKNVFKIHRIPPGLSLQDLVGGLTDKTHVMPLVVEKIQVKESKNVAASSKTKAVFGTTVALFESHGHANLFFHNLSDDIRCNGANGTFQKKVVLCNSKGVKQPAFYVAPLDFSPEK